MNASSLLPLFAAVVAFVAVLALTPLVRARARAAGMVAAPSRDRWHSAPTALLGGIAIFVGFLLSVLALLGFTATYRGLGQGEVFGAPLLGIVLAATLMFSTGLADDFFHLRPASKLVLQGLAGAVLVTLGVQYELTPWSVLNAAVTLFWFIALTNALNLLDNMDGAAAGVAAVAGLFFSILFALESAWALAIVSAALAGATAGFLRFNFHRASIFMGDCGSLFLGAVLAALGAAYSGIASEGQLFAAVAPVLIVMVPVFDTTLVSFTRTAAHYPLTQGGRDHVTHRLVAMGFSEPGAVLLLYGMAGAGGLCALLIAAGAWGAGPWLAALLLVALVVFGAYLSRFYHYAPESARPLRRPWILLGDLLVKRRVLEVLFDLVIFAVAYSGAFLLRYDAALPPHQVELLASTLALAVVCKSIAFGLSGVYRGIWHRLGTADVHRVLKATIFGSLLTIACMVFLFRSAEFSRTVFVLDAILVALLTLGARSSFRSLELVRYSLNGAGSPTLIYGAGEGGELLLREMLANKGMGLHPVGLIDDDPAKRGRAIFGFPILGDSRDIPGIVARRGIEKLVIGTRRMDRDQLHHVEGICRALGIELLQLELELRAVESVEWRMVSQRESVWKPMARANGAGSPLP